MSRDFCPLIKEPCKREGCMFWTEETVGKRKGNCSLNLFASTIGQIMTEEAEIQPEEVSTETSFRKSVELKESAEELVAQLIEFFKKEYPEHEIKSTFPHDISRLFWASKGLDSVFLFDSSTRLKMGAVEMKAYEKLNQERVQKEKEMLPKLIENCLEWARKQGVKRVTRSNVNFFLSESEVKVSSTTRDILYSKVNLELTKKP
jgi:hypothetical protein